MTTKRTYKQYPAEFKAEAVALINEQGYSVQKAANSLGIRSNMLYRWKDQLESQKAGTVLKVQLGRSSAWSDPHKLLN